MKLTDKQMEAIYKMEEFADISSHREIFNNKEEFQSYWELLDKKCKKKKRFIKAVEIGKVYLAEVRKKQQHAKLSFYQDFDHLLAYGEKYIQKYRPSSGKFLKQLINKCNDKDLAKRVFEKLSIRLNDAEQITEMVNKLARQGKGVFRIKIVLAQKMYPSNLIEQALLGIHDKHGKNIDDSRLSIQIRKMRKKGKSIKEISQKLRNSVYDKEDIKELIHSTTSETSDYEILEAAILKLKQKKVETKKIIQRLSQKGFSYGDIKKILDKGT